ncbi:hypothetical protein E0H75_07130 [Kribbella capetownensis]|uniref:Uncharacterized protein n=1 Tax=Kribbella capetownensis TaxID=1572659 RepID=A0A4R0K654_9ACTN|nr:hypothetical protein [Kribbella capetownensis]TCC53456.1 hypothetical protein E0H75_07130 [Kribbella capetownensis]
MPVTEADPVPEAPLLGKPMRERLWAVANVIAPTTVVTTLLFYFGYVATTARFRYFGVYLDMVDLTLQETLLYGAEAVYPPLIVVAIICLLGLAAHTTVRWLLSSPDRDAVTGWIGLIAALAGMLAFTRGVIGLLVPRVARTEAIATTPVALGCGALAVAYGCWLLRTVGLRWDRTRRRRKDVVEEGQAESPASAAAGDAKLADWLESSAVSRIYRYALAWVAVIVVAGSFWTANSFAAAYGRGRALDDAESLDGRPEVVLYTKEPLRDLPDGVEQTVLPSASTESLRFRYRGLRLLVESNARLFLVPARWVAGSSGTVVIPYDDSIRVYLTAR